MPPGYSITWSRQYEYMERAKERLVLVVPLTLVIIFLLLYFNFRSVAEAAIVMLSLPFAMIGGVWLVYLLDYNMSVAVGVGCIALAGVAAEIGVLMLVYLDMAYARARASREEFADDDPKRKESLHATIAEGAVMRIRPIMMTVTAVIGGMVTATLLTLIVIPVVYGLWKSGKAGRAVEE